MKRSCCIPVFCGVVLAAALFPSLAASRVICPPAIEPIEATSWDPYGAVSVCVVPGRPDLAKAHAYPGVEVTAGLSFHLDNWLEDPIAGLPVQVDCYGAPDLVLCAGSLDGLVIGADDRLTLAFSGGGSCRPDAAGGPEFFVPICPNQLLDAGGWLYFNSPDQDGDLKVDLADVAAFAADYHGAYDYSSDFNWDGSVNLVDVSVLAEAIGTNCQ